MRPRRIKGLADFRKIITKAETFDLPQEEVEQERITDTVGYAAIGR